MIHRLAHLLGWNFRHKEVWKSQGGRLMEGLRCAKCLVLTDIHPSPENRKTSARNPDPY